MMRVLVDGRLKHHYIFDNMSQDDMKTFSDYIRDLWKDYLTMGKRVAIVINNAETRYIDTLWNPNFVLRKQRARGE